MPLCGHATLASAAVVFDRLNYNRATVIFHSASGPLTVRRAMPGKQADAGKSYVMDFPARHYTSVDTPADLVGVLGVSVEETLWDGFNFIARLGAADLVRRLSPDLAGIARLACAGVVVTALGDGDHDCVSRYFAPAKGIPEDPVTGGAHCALAPYWARRIGKPLIRAFQASSRGGELLCRHRGDRVELEGSCVFYLEGTAEW